MIEYHADVKQELIDIIAIANRGESFSLTDRQLTMLFYWTRNKDKPEFRFVKEAFPNDQFINNKKARAKKKKTAKEIKKSKVKVKKAKAGAKKFKGAKKGSEPSNESKNGE